MGWDGGGRRIWRGVGVRVGLDSMVGVRSPKYTIYGNTPWQHTSIKPTCTDLCKQ